MENRVYLRALEPEDYKVSIEWRKDDEIWSQIGGPKYFVSEAFEKQWVLNTIDQSKNLKLAICTIDGNKYIGNVYLTDIDYINRKANTQILIGNHEYWNSGYGTEAMKLLLNFTFNERNLHKVEAIVLESNIASRKLHEKLGYIQEGRLIDSIFKNGKYQNQIIFGLINKEK